MSDSNPQSSQSDPQFSNILAECPELWDVVDMFARALPQTIQELQDALDQSAFDQLIESARALALSGGGHGYPELVAYASAIERSAREGMVKSLETQLAELRSLTDRIREGIDSRSRIRD
ncbi:MAG: Hpt domain-containing protein [Phycisphaerae bacterium]|nr:Hpt domain-containing protein [Phycisphaerae bacterium]